MSRKDPAKNILSTVGRFAFSAALLWYLFSKIDMTKTVAVVKEANLLYVFYAFITFFAINFVLVGRWMIYIRAMELKVPFKVVLRYFFIGLFGNLFLPSAIGGDVIKTIGLCRYSPHKARVVATVLLDRLSGFAGMVVVAILAVTVGFPLVRDMSLVAMIGGMAVLSTVIVGVLFNEKWYAFCCRIFEPFPKLKRGLMNVHYNVVLLKDRRVALYQAVAASCLAQIIYAGTFYYLAKSLSIDAHYLSMLIFVPLICVASSFPSIGGLGVREATVAYLFAKVGIDSGLSVSMSLVNFVFMVFGGLVGGVIYMVTKAPDVAIEPAAEAARA